MKFISAFCAGLLSLMAVAAAQAQVQVQFSQARNLYLQYEAIDLTIALTNVTDGPVVLAPDSDGKSWLSFLAFDQNGSVVNQVKNVEIGQINLAPGETKRVTINILPFYAIRSTGGFSVQAVISIPGLTPVMTGKLYFTIGKGETMWKHDAYNAGVKRTYSLVRFLDVTESNLYLRVEEPDQNLVYSTVRLGKIVAFADPAVEFDALGNIHIVQVIGSRNYRYTEADANGRILKQEDRSAVVGMTTPTVAKANDGTVQFIGGVTKKDATERVKLSETQGSQIPAGAAQ
jgi:hypothetical protein